MIEEVMKLVGGLLRWINETREARRRNREWTTAEEDAYRAHIESQMQLPHWKPKDDPGS